MPTALPTIDFHTHLDRQQPLTTAGSTIRIISVPQNEADLPLPENCFGTLELHPWHGESMNSKFAQTTEAPKFIGIGEVGLDRLKGKLSLDGQIAEFTRTVLLANNLGKPLTIHCVKCFSELLELYKRLKWRVPTIIHYYRSNLKLARQLWEHTDWVLSLPPAICGQKELLDFLRSNPEYQQKIVLETDDPHHGDIEAHYKVISEALDISYTALQKLMLEQFKRLYRDSII